MRWFAFLLVYALAICGCLQTPGQDIANMPATIVQQPGSPSQESANDRAEVDTMKITSPDFTDGEYIPKIHTCDGEDMAPALKFHDVPKEAKCLVLISEDPDAPMGTWVHWTVFNIPPGTQKIGHGEVYGTEGLTSFGKAGYGGPCPPGGTHRYFFLLYALDQTLDLDGSAKKEDIERAMEGRIIAHAKIMGKYSRG